MAPPGVGWDHNKGKLYIYLSCSYRKNILLSTKSSLLNSWLPGVGWGHNRGNHFTYYDYIGKLFKKFIVKNHRAREFQICMETFWQVC
jgi:hypothetical protein